MNDKTHPADETAPVHICIGFSKCTVYAPRDKPEWYGGASCIHYREFGKSELDECVYEGSIEEVMPRVEDMRSQSVLRELVAYRGYAISADDNGQIMATKTTPYEDRTIISGEDGLRDALKTARARVCRPQGTAAGR